MIYPYAESLLDPKNCSSKRVSRACDRCRLKKTKCDGRRCCNRCLADDAICVFSKRKRSSDRPYSSEYVQLLEDQQTKLVEGVQELYRRLRRGEGWIGPKIAEDSQGYPLVQDVLDSLSLPAPSERRGVKRKAEEANLTEPDDEDEQNIPFDDSAHPDLTSPPLTPVDGSLSSSTSSPVDDYPRDRFSIAYVPSQYQQMAAKVQKIGPGSCQQPQIMPSQPFLTDGTDYWSTTSSYNGIGIVTDFSGLVSPFANSHGACNWYPSTYAMM